MKTIDINCDMGEGYGHYRIGNDLAIFPFVTSTNIACGFHGGDPLQMHRTIEEAVKHQVQIGAHPGFPDLAGFGRRNMELSPEELQAVIKYQLAAIIGVAKSLNTAVKYVKPHGALYHMAAESEEIALTIIKSAHKIDRSLWIMGLAGSLFQDICENRNIPFIAEGFADRSYTDHGKLNSRSTAGSLITDPETAATQVLDMVTRQQVKSSNGSIISLQVQSICVHGDNPAAVDILKAIDSSLNQAGVKKKSML